jgi:hypothetical protein
MEPACVGTDVPKDRLDAAVLPGGEASAVARDAAGLDALLARLKPLAPRAIALEAAGGYETVAAAAAAAALGATAGLPVAAVVNPARRVRAFAKGARPARRGRPGRRRGRGHRPLRGRHPARATAPARRGHPPGGAWPTSSPGGASPSP